MITDDSLKQIMPKLTVSKRAIFLPPLQSAMSEFAVNTPKREAAFLAQIAHESAELTILVENLYYSADSLMRTWPKRFPDLDTARQYERNPEKLANYVYANRIGNGDEASGDGWRFRGRGPIQITGRENYVKYGRLLAVDLVHDFEKAATPEVGFRIAGLFWQLNHLNELADLENFVAITGKINAGLLGLEDRKQYYNRAKEVLGLPVSKGLDNKEFERDIMEPPQFTRGSEELEKFESEKSDKPKKTRAKRTSSKVKAERANQN